ncbi:hypothetical protein HU200_056598 [Digitaria exilis]|uniref:Uncharacterized protein n=1 Tax=Digitaria exilis TaxID=1010633 RepID=A0A835AM57_9POAL|nr:hypothetical protein HU200_056598 [Digitaria exilis]
MAYFAIDPRPHDLGHIEQKNEDLAITYLVPEVRKEDCEPMAQAMKDFPSQLTLAHVARWKMNSGILEERPNLHTTHASTPQTCTSSCEPHARRTTRPPTPRINAMHGSPNLLRL